MLSASVELQTGRPLFLTNTDKGDAGYDMALKNRHLQMITIGGSIGTGLSADTMASEQVPITALLLLTRWLGSQLRGPNHHACSGLHHGCEQLVTAVSCNLVPSFLTCDVVVSESATHERLHSLEHVPR